jgi:hypothetical protein
MSLRLRRLAAATAVAAAGLGTVAVTAGTAHALGYPWKLVYEHTYQGSDALAQCQADGAAGQAAGDWDIYKCIQVSGPTYVELQGYLNIS